MRVLRRVVYRMNSKGPRTELDCYNRQRPVVLAAVFLPTAVDDKDFIESSEVILLLFGTAWQP